MVRVQICIFLLIGVGLFGVVMTVPSVHANTAVGNAAQCYNAGVAYSSGARVPGLKLSSGLELSLAGFEYVCTQGRWVFEAVGASASAQTNPTQIPRCTSGTDTYPEGTRRTSIMVNGTASAVSDASYVCRNGQWRIESTLSPVSSSTIVANGYLDCYIGDTTYKHGEMYVRTNAASPVQVPVFFRPSSTTTTWCTNGQWTLVSPTTPCKIGTSIYPAGSSMSNPRLFERSAQQIGFISENPFILSGMFSNAEHNWECLAGEWVIKMRAENAVCKMGTATYQHGQRRDGISLPGSDIVHFRDLFKAWCYRGQWVKERDGTPFPEVSDRNRSSSDRDRTNSNVYKGSR